MDCGEAEWECFHAIVKMPKILLTKDCHGGSASVGTRLVIENWIRGGAFYGETVG
jgi:hypothetical protein